MRLPRIKTPDRLTYYHVRARVAGCRHWYPFHDPIVQEQIKRLLKRFLRLYFCDLVGWTLMGNHIHLVLRFQPFRILSHRQLSDRARAYYPRPVDRPHNSRQWKQFNRRLFDLSEFMRNFNGAIATWFNRTYQRRGSLFAGRFQSSILESLEDVLNCLFYIDLNPVRAGLVDRPELWHWGSAWQRLTGNDGDLVPLRELMPGRSEADCRLEYKLRLHWRGAIGGEQGKCQIPDHLIRAELARKVGYGKDLKRQRWISQGILIGCYESVAEWLEKLRGLMLYRRRRNPIQQLEGTCFTLRPQRLRAWDQSCARPGAG